MIILVDGPDRVGKSTLINALVRSQPDRQWSVAVNGMPPRPPEVEDTWEWLEEQYMLLYTDLAESSRRRHRDWLVDRSHLSELVYGTVYRGRDPADYKEPFAALEEILMGETLALVLTAHPMKLWAREDGESQSRSAKDVAKDVAMFQLACDLTTLPVEHLWTGGLGKRDVTDWASTKIQDWRRRLTNGSARVPTRTGARKCGCPPGGPHHLLCAFTRARPGSGRAP